MKKIVDGAFGLKPFFGVSRWFVAAMMSVFLFVGAGVFAEEVGKVLSVETGYGVVVSSRDLNVTNPHGLVTSLYWGYVIGDKPNSMTVLSIAAGYDFFPLDPGVTVLHNMVYGVEYAHIFWRRSPVSLLLDYGLLFNLLIDAERTGYAFGHHTRLGIGAMWNVSERHKLTFKGSYNFVTFPHFENSESQYSFPAGTIRYSLFF